MPPPNNTDAIAITAILFDLIILFPRFSYVYLLFIRNIRSITLSYVHSIPNIIIPNQILYFNALLQKTKKSGRKQNICNRTVIDIVFLRLQVLRPAISDGLLIKLIPNYSCILVHRTIIHIGNLDTVTRMNNLTVTHINRNMIHYTGL